ncbi:peptidoglycan-binding protein [Alkalihalobacillus trypoxylicola]|uniref:peptidoglycan-binding protein n=1 Tax=Alkalihalobacillus trypoxylicola TaxID=519424 RepID=UPI001470CD1C|nr:peptidoglycan-binding protein [Alkalihalobacillus trypoxylicola]
MRKKIMAISLSVILIGVHFSSSITFAQEGDIESNNEQTQDESSTSELEVDNEQLSSEDDELIVDKEDVIEENAIETSTEDEEKINLEDSKIEDDTEEITETKSLNQVLHTASNELKNGDRDQRVVTLKRNLAKLGFPVPGNGTTLFGFETEKQVREFQKYYGIPVTGTLNMQTENKIADILKTPLQNGKRHNDTIQLKKDLEFLGYPVPGNGTNVFGDDTEKVIKQFQKTHNLVWNGIADEVTLAKIKELKSAPLSNGMRREDVKTLKENLAKLGFPVPGSGTNLYGNDTERKVREFQAYYKLPVDGVAGSSTINKINSVLNSPLQNGKRHNDTIQLKKDLALLGYPVPGNGTHVFGDDTEKIVKQFQKAHKLIQNGIGDERTLAKIEELKSAPLSNGMRREDVKTLKENLAKLGFTVSGSGTNLYGNDTERKVREFQAYYKLSVDGIAGPGTINKMNSVLNSPLQNGKRNNATKQLKEDLAILGYPVPGNGTTLYGNDTERVVRQFQRDYKLAVNGIADEITLAKIADLIKNPVVITEYTNYGWTLNQAINYQMQGGRSTTDKYRDAPAFVHKDFIQILGSTSTGYRAKLSKGENIGSTTADRNRVRVFQAASNTSHLFGYLTYNSSRDTIVEVIGELSGNWYTIKYDTFRYATSSDVREFLDPNRNDQFQHLRLDSSVGVASSELNKVIQGKGILSGQGQAFINGGRIHGINEIYLISHALHETGNGSSVLANGVRVGKNRNGQLVRVTSSNERNLTEIKTTYNMYGIGAIDNDAVNAGAIRAYEEGWFTPASAIEGGAKWIGERYIHNADKQNTLYKMKWNPNMSNGGWRQYATDIGWAVKQTTNMKNMYNQLNNPRYHYDIARYN